MLVFRIFYHRFIIQTYFTGGSIPDAALIHAARKHRQQARELGGLADYIKLDDTQPNQETEQASVTSARLVREDENDKSDEEEGEDGRVDFSVDLMNKDKQKRREAFLAAEQEGIPQKPATNLLNLNNSEEILIIHNPKI